MARQWPRPAARGANKFGAERTEDGYDSKREAKRARELAFLVRAGVISDLRAQVPFELLPAQRDAAGKLIERNLRYVADFVYTERRGAVVVEDCKGFRTPDYIIKRKLLLFRHGIRIKEV